MPRKKREKPGKKFTDESFERFLDLAADDHARLRKRGPGHPITTGMRATPKIQYRVSAAQHDELEAEARTLPRRGRRFMTASAVAKARAFPRDPQ